MNEVVSKPAETPPPPSRKKRILVVEDESTTRLFLLNQLKKAGLEVEAAANGNIGLKKIKDGRFDAVILDLMLPGIKGQDFIKEVRKKESLADIPIFVCTSAQRMEPWRRRGAKAGATKVFDKAAPVDSIVAEIVNHLATIKAATEAPATAAKGETVPQPVQGRTPEISPLVPETVFTQTPPVIAAAPANVNAATKEGGQPLFTPLPAGRDSTPAIRPPVAAQPAASPLPTPAPAASPVTAAAPPTAVAGKTGFFHNPDPRPAQRTTNTSLLRKAAKAGQAAAQQSVPVISGDTPLLIPLSEDAPVRPSTPAAAAKAEPPAAPEPVKERTPGLAELIIAPFKMFSSRGDDGEKVNDLKEQLAEVTKNRDELLALLRDHPIFGPQPQSEGLDEAKAAAKRAEAAYQAELARSKQFEEELKRIREARDDLNKKLAREEEAAAESRRRSRELEDRLAHSSSELEQVKTELQKNITEHSKLEGELRQQLNSARQSAEQAKVAYQAEAARAARSTEDLVALQQAREELNAKLTAEGQAAAESKGRSEQREQQLRETAAEVERLKADLAKHTAQGLAQAELAEKLKAAEAAARNAEAACKEEAGRGAQFEKELARLNRAREELNERLVLEERAAAESRRRSEEMERQLAASAAELHRVKGELERHVHERSSLESELQQQVAAANAAADQARREFQQETTIFQRSKEEVEALRQARDQLNTQLEQEQHAAAESRRHSQELETRLQQNAQELERLRSELEKHVSERASLVTASSRQLQAAKGAASKAEKAYQQQVKRNAKFEEELAELRAQLDGKAKTEQKSSAKSRKRIKELEQRAAEYAAELERARKELEKNVAEHARLENEQRQAVDTADPAQTEARFRESISALARATAQLEKERGERRRGEQRSAFLSSQLENLHDELRKHLAVEKESQQRIAEFEQQLREREEALAKAVTDLQKESASRQLVEAQLSAKSEIDSKLEQQFSLVDEAKKVFSGAQEKLEQRLQAALASLKQTQAKLQKQISERKRMEASLEDAQRKAHEQSQQSATEIARLQSALQLELIERRKVESQSLQSRYASVDASRLGRAFVNSFRTQLRPAAEALLQSTRRLLELPLEDEHKRLVEDALESALLLQTSMQDDARLPGENDSGETAKAA